MSTALTPSTFVAYRPLLQLSGRVYRLETQGGELLLEVKMKAFRLKEAIVGYADSGRSDARLRIQARSILDFGATYDVVDARTGERLGAWRRKGLKSILRDTWTLLDSGDREIGELTEDSMLLALIRRFLLNLIPQTFSCTVNGSPAGDIRQRFHLFRLTYDVRLDPDKVEPRLAQAIAVLLLAIEGRQQ
jgi:hypothetical protein